jgi:4-hydroxy-3-methylbut-2-en-1-yl diphosphate reductase
LKILLANPRGFCAGVDRAIQIVEKALELYGKPIYVRHEIVHNKAVVERLQSIGAIFVEDVAEVPEGKTVIFSAHGVAEKVYVDAKERQLKILDASCPLVKKVHFSAKKHNGSGATIILIGHAGHPEVEGTMGQLPQGQIALVGSPEDVSKLPFSPTEPLAYITQTTLSLDETREVITALRERYPNIMGPEKGDLCYATTNRQSAVRELCTQVDVLLIVGSSNSSNSNRLRELGAQQGIPSYLINSEVDIQKQWLTHAKNIGISSGASAPEHIVQSVISWLHAHFPISSVENVVTMEEQVKFSLPNELRTELSASKGVTHGTI